MIGLTSLVASPALAQEAPEHSVFILNSLLFLMAGFLVMFMACGLYVGSGSCEIKKYHNATDQKHFTFFDSRCWLLHTRVQPHVSAWNLVS